MFYKIDKNHSWNTDPLIKDISGVVFEVKKGSKIEMIWYNRRKDIWSYSLTNAKYKAELNFWAGKRASEFSKCTKKEAEEMLGYKI